MKAILCIALMCCLVAQVLSKEKAKDLKDSAAEILSDAGDLAGDAYEYAKEKLVDLKDLGEDAYESVHETVKERWTQAEHVAGDLKDAAAAKVRPIDLID